MTDQTRPRIEWPPLQTRPITIGDERYYLDVRKSGVFVELTWHHHVMGGPQAVPLHSFVVDPTELTIGDLQAHIALAIDNLRAGRPLWTDNVPRRGGLRPVGEIAKRVVVDLDIERRVREGATP